MFQFTADSVRKCAEIARKLKHSASGPPMWVLFYFDCFCWRQQRSFSWDGFCLCWLLYENICVVLMEFNSQPYLNVKSNSLIGLLNSMWGFWHVFRIEDKVSLIFQVCSHDGNCPRSEKCCFDKCLNHHTCKPALRTPPRNWAWNPNHTNEILRYFFVIGDYFCKTMNL